MTKSRAKYMRKYRKKNKMKNNKTETIMVKKSLHKKIKKACVEKDLEPDEFLGLAVNCFLDCKVYVGEDDGEEET